jgi:phenylalanyl-tRNA synthetase alpha chain
MSTNVQTVIADIQAAVEQAEREIAGADSLDAINQLTVRLLGRSGTVTAFARQIGAVPPEEKRAVGEAFNQAKRAVEEKLQGAREALEAAGANRQELADAVDVTLPGIRNRVGRLHPITDTMNRMKEILVGLGFSYQDYPEIESDRFNFEYLNLPPWHPARDMHDSFYIRRDVGQAGELAGQADEQDRLLLRTHTSAFQAHAMREYGDPPIRAMTSGRCYRRDEIDASHFPAFHQLDAIGIDTSLSMADLKWTLNELLRSLFGPTTQTRFRPSYFPFTTPSAEVDVSCSVCQGAGCPLCKYSGWIEVLGTGMMRPEVLRYGGIDPDRYQGFAFGIGVDRIAMIRYQIQDIRLLFSNGVDTRSGGTDDRG